MRRFWLLHLGLAVALHVAFAVSLRVPGLGAPLWHHNVGMALVLVALAGAWRPLQARRVATLAMAWSGALSTVSGFVMLYTVDLPVKDVVTWWHSVTSVALLGAFLVHWLHNQPRLADFTRRVLARPGAAGLLVATAWLAVIAAFGWTWLTEARRSFVRENYLYLSSWAVLAGVGLPYGLWLAYRAPRLRARLDVPDHRNRLRALVDTSLFLAHWGALLTGFVLLWFAGPLRGGDLKYVSKWWHTATSVAFLALVVLHVGFNARALAAHARRVDDDLDTRLARSVK